MQEMSSGNATEIGDMEPGALEFQQFRDSFPTQADCCRELYRWMGDRVRCQICGSGRWQIQEGTPCIRCLDCRKKSWPKAGTYFHRIRNLQATMGALYLMNRGVIVTASSLARLAGVSNACAVNVKKRLKMVIERKICRWLHVSLIFAVCISYLQAKPRNAREQASS